ncbi:MAG: ROK family protein [Bacteroidetes bacterium]|nr:ROK family protein [Bacteroidota bacterium]
MKYSDDSRIVMTLDAGGTNFVFSAVKSEQEIIEPVVLSAKGSDLKEILQNIIDGFRQVAGKVDGKPAAISFAFPGPADYENGIIGDLQNLPAFRGGVALGPMLEATFGIPVFINNDGDLFAYGEAISGLLPEVNKKLEEAGNPKRYRNLLGVTFGTGFGGGIVTRGELFLGDNSAQGEINRMRNHFYKKFDVEESLSIRGIRMEFANYTGINLASTPGPKEIALMAEGLCPGDQDAAIKAYQAFGRAAGDALANAITLVDGLIVMGGGLSHSHPLFLPSLIEEMNSHYETLTGLPLDRLEIKAFNLEDPQNAQKFYARSAIEINVPFSDRKIIYDPGKKTGIGVSRLGTSNAVSIGAYAFALSKLDKR